MIDENEIIPEGIIEDEEFKTDKIFDNQFEQTELDTTEKSFQIDPSFTEKVLDEKIDEKMISDQIRIALSLVTKFDKFNIKLEDGTFPKLNKNDINEIYRYVLDAVPGVPIIEAFSIITSTFNIKKYSNFKNWYM